MKKILIVFGLLLATSWLTAQPRQLAKPVRSLPFAHLERNHIIYPNDEPILEGFFNKLDSVVFFGKGNLSILHLGDSHIQAGQSTQQLRNNLLSIGTQLMGGQFLAFPYGAGKTNNPSYYIVNQTGDWQYCRNAVKRPDDKRMGLAGAALTTSDPKATINIVSRERTRTALSPEFKFNKVTLMGYSEKGNTMPVLRCRGSVYKGNHNASQSTYVFDLPFFTDSLSICFESMRGDFTLTGVLLENGMDGISLHGIGVNGAALPSYLRCDDFERDLRMIHPDLVILAIGTNDAYETEFNKAEFKRNYSRLISIIRSVNPDCALLFVTNNDCYRSKKGRKNKTIYEVNTNNLTAELAFGELAKEHHIALWDLFDIMGGLKSMQSWDNAGLAQKDRVHFSSEGYQLVGDLMFNALMERYTEHLTAKASKH